MVAEGFGSRISPLGFGQGFLGVSGRRCDRRAFAMDTGLPETRPMAHAGYGAHDHVGSFGHGHSHGHGDSLPASARTRRLVSWILAPTAAATLVGLILLWPGVLHATPPAGLEQRAYGDVTAVHQQACPPGPGPGSVGGPQVCGTATVKVTDGPGSGRTVTVDLPTGPGAPSLSTGDAVVLDRATDPASGAARTRSWTTSGAGSCSSCSRCAAAVIVALGPLARHDRAGRAGGQLRRAAVLRHPGDPHRRAAAAGRDRRLRRDHVRGALPDQRRHRAHLGGDPRHPVQPGPDRPARQPCSPP